jgi:hypothetical protein
VLDPFCGSGPWPLSRKISHMLTRRLRPSETPRLAHVHDEENRQGCQPDVEQRESRARP